MLLYLIIVNTTGMNSAHHQHCKLISSAKGSKEHFLNSFSLAVPLLFHCSQHQLPVPGPQGWITASWPYPGPHGLWCAPDHEGAPFQQGGLPAIGVCSTY